MNLTNHQILTTNPGVIAVVTLQGGHVSPTPTAWGVATWHPLMQHCAMALLYTPKKSMRVVIGDHLIHVEALGPQEQVVAVVVESAHPINKSIHRMMRRSVGPWTAPRHERQIAPPRPRTKGVKAAKPTEPARPAMPPADTIEPAPVDILTETRRAVASDTPRMVRTPDPTPSIEMPRGDQW
jgi:hypothetical protein